MQYAAVAVSPRYITKRRARFAKAYGIKVRCLGYVRTPSPAPHHHQKRGKKEEKLGGKLSHECPTYSQGIILTAFSKSFL